jgi:hypothetical protein
VRSSEITTGFQTSAPPLRSAPDAGILPGLDLVTAGARREEEEEERHPDDGERVIIGGVWIEAPWSFAPWWEADVGHRIVADRRVVRVLEVIGGRLRTPAWREVA